MASLTSRDLWYVRPTTVENGQPSLTVWSLSGGAYLYLRYVDGVEFVVGREGRSVWAAWPETSTVADMATYLLGPVMGLVLRLRGVVSLHASAVSVGGRAIALLGPAGAGKSTTAAAFAMLGYPVLCDDVAALVECDGAFLVQPAAPRLRLWPESVQALFGSHDALPRLTPTWDKRAFDLQARGYLFEPRALPLTAIYLLEERSADADAPFIEPVSAPAGMIPLVANTYVNYLLDRTMRAQEFEILGRLLARVPVRRVTPQADPATLPGLCEAILDDLAAIDSWYPRGTTAAGPV